MIPAMARLPISHPAVQRAIRRRMLKREALRCRRVLLAELAERGRTWPELVELTEFSKEQVAAALNQLMIAERIERVDGFRYRLVDRDGV